jgi:hypothetical protein
MARCLLRNACISAAAGGRGPSQPQTRMHYASRDSYWLTSVSASAEAGFIDRRDRHGSECCARRASRLCREAEAHCMAEARVATGGGCQTCNLAKAPMTMFGAVFNISILSY